ncbi:MAG TPA: hypothetical protein VJN93_05190 [Candidatus Acidoferrum sp.]|nr:hypothetical protein [Candidatus Acidoferrum sp.]
MKGKSGTSISRREFARRAALVSAASLVPPVAPALTRELAPSHSQLPSDTPALSPESQAEAEARYQTILSTYAGRFSDEQKSELRRLTSLAQPSLDHLRAYSIHNGDNPALYLKPLIEREKNPLAGNSAHTPSPAAKKP